MAWSLAGALRLWQVIWRAHPMRVEALEAVMDELGDAVGFLRRPRILASDEVSAPFCVGFLRPVVVLPADAALDQARLRMVLSHELAHLRQLDHVWTPLSRLVGVLLFFHPGFYIASRQFRSACEEICDERALSLMSDRRGYAACLMRFAELSAFGRPIDPIALVRLVAYL